MNDLGSIEGRFFYLGLLEALAQGMGSAKRYLADHGPRTAILAHALGRRVGLYDRALAELFFAAVLADLGMIGLVEEASETPRLVLEGAARDEVCRHPCRSAAAIRDVPFLGGVEGLIWHHHEWWNGSGYPDGLREHEIPLGARILRVADTVTALGQDRPQRPGLALAEICTLVEHGAGSEFDPELARLWLDLHRTGELPRFNPVLYRNLRSRSLEILADPRMPEASSMLLLELLASLIDAKDPYTGGHSRRVARLAEAVVREVGWGRAVEEHARAAGYLHDLGKLSVPARLLRKGDVLRPGERVRVRRHATDGARVLQGIPALRSVAPACRYHHERWDGTGYPDGLAGRDIPRMARILGVCDAYDAMTSARAYRPAMTHDYALHQIRDGSGSQFSPMETEAFLSLPEELFEALHDGPRSGHGLARLGPTVSPFRRNGRRAFGTG